MVRSFVMLSLVLFLLPIRTSVGNACTCAGERSHRDFVEASDIAFVGYCLTAFADPTAEPQPPGTAGARPMIYAFIVDEPLRNVKKRREYAIRSIDDEAACGIAFQPGERYLVYAKAIRDRVIDPDTLYGTDLCQGSRAVGDEIQDSLAVWAQETR